MHNCRPEKNRWFEFRERVGRVKDNGSAVQRCDPQPSFVQRDLRARGLPLNRGLSRRRSVPQSHPSLGNRERTTGDAAAAGRASIGARRKGRLQACSARGTARARAVGTAEFRGRVSVGGQVRTTRRLCTESSETSFETEGGTHVCGSEISGMRPGKVPGRSARVNEGPRGKARRRLRRCLSSAL